MEEKEPKKLGLSTREALNRLETDIKQLLNQFTNYHSSRKSKSWISDALHHSSLHSILNWIAVLIIAITSLLLVVSSIITLNFSLLFQALFIFILLPLNVFINLFHSKLRHKEIPRRVEHLIETIRNEKEKIDWKAQNYPHLLAPFSPCITLQWTYRDNKLVNLPWALLVRGDIIIIRPGQVSPGYCESLDKHAEYPLLHAKEVYGPALKNANETFSNPKSRKPLDNKKYRVLETPYLSNLQIALEQALDRPITVQDQQRYFIMVKIIQRVLVPLTLVLAFIGSWTKYKFFNFAIVSYSWVDIFVLNIIAIELPLLPLVFPLAWILLSYVGMARFITIYSLTSNTKNLDSFLVEESPKLESVKYRYCFRKILDNFVFIAKGKESMMTRTTNIVHVLGSITALCCVDKKGILSWPNPTADKIFFLRNVDSVSQASSLANLGELSTDADSLKALNNNSIRKSEDGMITVGEVLDLTHNQNDPFKLQFDDTNWKKHLNSLKPLGLAILLNTCNLETQEDYTKFCSHITCEAMYNENLVPVTNRRCLCELAKEIGFINEAPRLFALEQHLSTFRHLTEMARRDKYVRSLQLATKLKFPFPHMFSVIVKELSTGSMQLLSQGTADIIVDSCIDYWDGYDLCSLSHSDRKKIQDFYQRSSLTSYCTAFAYRPLHKNVSAKLSQTYLELPSDSRHLYINQRSPTPIHSDCRSVLEPRIKLNQSYDSLLYDSPPSDISDIDSCFETQCNQVFIGMVTMQYQAQMDMVQLIEQLESACIRFVHFSKENELRSRVFSEKMGLESGWNCHISLLSEKSRRESGPSECWANNGTARVSSPADLPRRVSDYKPNSPTSDVQHKFDSSLDSAKGISHSAPSAINLEHSVVKFETEKEPLSNTDDNLDMDLFSASHESVQLQADLNSISHEWQSLSCLTDSTEQSVPINFDMSNRAKLPRGIDKIRPHIEHIDNVPLLVSLFTDCTASSTKEMIKIMQDYGEVICVIGSSANFETMGIFMQADASIAIEPLYPQICQKSEVCKKEIDVSISPIDLSRALNSVSCCLSVKREDPVSIFHLITESRHYMSLVWNTVQFWVCSCLSLSLLQIVAIYLLLPPILTTGQVLWFCGIVIPILSLSMMGTPMDPDMIKKPQGKKQIGFNLEIFIFVLWCYGGKFLPMITAAIITFGGTLASYCTDICMIENCTCTLFYLPNRHINSTLVDSHSNDFFTSVPSAQNLCVILILLHLVALSAGFVHREHLIWRKSPHKNIFWLVSIVIVLILQLIFSLINMSKTSRSYENILSSQIANYVTIFAFLSPIITFVLHEIVKREEIKTNLRYQRRARLDFGTKLGMNSPF